jgi:hypothetical protein
MIEIPIAVQTPEVVIGAAPEAVTRNQRESIRRLA